MADVLKENLTDTAINGTMRTPPTLEGVALAYASLILMALLPIFFGSFRSVNHWNKQSADVRFFKPTHLATLSNIWS